MVIHIASSGTQRRKMLVRVYVQAQPTRRGHSRDCVNRQQSGISIFMLPLYERIEFAV